MAIRITFDTKTIDLLLGDDGLLINYTQEREQERSGSGKTETINLYGIQEMAFEAYFTESIYRDLIAWWSWARQGKSWAFAKDSNNVGNTTLEFIANEGQTAINLVASGSTAFSVGDICFLRAEDTDDEFEMIEIDAINPTGDIITATANLKFTYPAGSIFRHPNYWPDVVSLDTSFNPKRNGDYYKHIFKFAENL